MPDPFKNSTDALDLRLLVAGIEELDVGFTVFDADLRLVAANTCFREMLGFPQALCVPGTPFSAFMRYNAERGEYGAGEIDRLAAERIEQAQRFLPHRFERIRPDGVVIDVSGRPLPGGGMVTIYTDITAQRRREQTLKELSEELERRVEERTAELRHHEAELARKTTLLEQVMGHVDQGVSLMNGELKLELCNSQFLEIMRFPAAYGTPGTPFEAFIRVNAERGEYGPGEVEGLIQTRVDIAKKHLPHRVERIRPDGTSIEVIGNPIPGGDSSPLISTLPSASVPNRCSRKAKHS